MARPIPDQGADTKPCDSLALHHPDQLSVEIQLLFPLRLLIHHRVGTGELVVPKDHAIVSKLLGVDLPRDQAVVDLNKDPFFIGPVLGLGPLSDDMESRAQHLPQRVRHIDLDVLVMLLPQPTDAGRGQKLSHRVVTRTLFVVVF